MLAGCPPGARTRESQIQLQREMLFFANRRVKEVSLTETNGRPHCLNWLGQSQDVAGPKVNLPNTIFQRTHPKGLLYIYIIYIYIYHGWMFSSIFAKSIDPSTSPIAKRWCRTVEPRNQYTDYMFQDTAQELMWRVLRRNGMLETHSFVQKLSWGLAFSFWLHWNQSKSKTHERRGQRGTQWYATRDIIQSHPPRITGLYKSTYPHKPIVSSTW